MKNLAKTKLKTNLDTNLLKLIAIIAMIIDHVGTAFFPEYPIFRWIGRIAFPIFCYCLTVGLLYTHDIKKYLLRLGIFAIVSQPFYVLAFHHTDFWLNITNLNIFFTLFITILAMWGFKEHKWWLFILGFLALSLFNFDYSMNGVILMLIFYLCRNKPKIGALLFLLNYIPYLFNTSLTDSYALIIGDYAVGFEFLSILAIPLIFLKTNSKLNIPKYFFYIFYPLHLFIIFIIKILFA